METKGHYLGGMPPSLFIKKFFPAATSATVEAGRTPFAAVMSDSVKTEADMYERFVRPPSARLVHLH
jgi:hypothetical protein